MADFPQSPRHRLTVSTASLESFGLQVLLNNAAAPASATWPAANRAIYVPFVITSPILVRMLWWANGSAVAGNVDCGIYSATANGATLLVSTGSTAQATTNIVQSVTLGTPFLLLPGSYYFALASSSTSATFFRSAASVFTHQMYGLAQQASALPLPATATFASSASAYVPVFGLSAGRVI